MNLLLSLHSEIKKTKRTAAFYFTFIGAGIVPAIFLISIIGHDLPEKEKTAKDQINAIFKISSEMTSLCILPLFVVLLCTLLPQIEFRNNTWKQVLSSPQKKIEIYIAKFLNIQALIILFLIANHLFLWIVILVAHVVFPHYHILSHSFDFSGAIATGWHAYISVLAISTIQFWIGLRARNFLIPIAIGLACWLAGTIMLFEYHSSASLYFPYCFPIIRFSDTFRPQVPQVEWLCLAYATIVLAIGFLDFRSRKMAR